MNTDIHKLLRLKRYETPTSDYFERFLDEFNERQRSELLRQPTWNLLWERLVGVFPEFRVPNLAYAGVAAAAVVLSTFILVTQKTPRRPVPVWRSMIPALRSTSCPPVAAISVSLSPRVLNFPRTMCSRPGR